MSTSVQVLVASPRDAILAARERLRTELSPQEQTRAKQLRIAALPSDMQEELRRELMGEYEWFRFGGEPQPLDPSEYETILRRYEDDAKMRDMIRDRRGIEEDDLWGNARAISKSLPWADSTTNLAKEIDRRNIAAADKLMRERQRVEALFGGIK